MNTKGLSIYSAVRALSPGTAQWLSQLRFRMAAAMPFKPNPESNLIVSLTTFPARSHLAWIPVECIFQQDYKPAAVVLVLSEDQFPGRVLPPTLEKQQRRGLEILWTQGDIGSYKKLLPTRQKYPDAYIVTFDDDLWLQSWRVGNLVAAARKRPETIVGHRGWEIQLSNGGLAPYIEWPEANPDTPSQLTFLTGGAGAIYPPNLLPIDLLCDYQRAAQLAPRADDIWFWAVTRHAGLSIHCLGENELDRIEGLRETPALELVNRTQGKNDEYLAGVINYFGLWDELSKPHHNSTTM